MPEKRFLQTPFPRLSYDEAMARYGSDKPDLRFEMALVDLSEIVAHSTFRVFSGALAEGGVVKLLVGPGLADYSRKQIDELEAIAKILARRGWRGPRWMTPPPPR